MILKQSVLVIDIRTICIGLVRLYDHDNTFTGDQGLIDWSLTGGTTASWCGFERGSPAAALLLHDLGVDCLPELARMSE